MHKLPTYKVLHASLLAQRHAHLNVSIAQERAMRVAGVAYPTQVHNDNMYWEYNKVIPTWSYLKVARALLAAGLPATDLPANMHWRQASKLTDAELLAALQATGPAY